MVCVACLYPLVIPFAIMFPRIFIGLWNFLQQFLASLFGYDLPTAEAEVQDHGRVEEIRSKFEWDSKLRSAGTTPVVVDFTASWCGPCKTIAPTYYALSSKYEHVVFLKVDVDRVPEVAEEAGVRSMPTFHVYKGGKKVEGMVGAMKSQLEAMVKRCAY
eukprot:TRINITY_DN16780_c0_g1_i1.p1 TRINITY_DN16780_c0_g1~~TRINITY_DN16780_c0_g1_i1.p1  ORF type:complete len:159 (-),score=15.29 TRINITY_DN16780_c0_g1_i1:410-886(-)